MASRGSTIGRHLLRLTHSVPLKTLQQGSTLSIRSQIPNVAVRIQSGWRDDGQATFDQHFAGKNALTLSSADSRISGLKIVQEADQVTSLGRCESHLALILEAVSLDKDVLSLASSPPTEEDQDTSSVDFRDGDA